MPKVKAAIYWCSSCGGCDESIVDLGERILAIRELVDFVFWPCAMDPKTSDVEALADGELAVSLINGAIRTSEQEEMAKLLRRKSQLVVAFGSCACSGGIPALANLKSRKAIFDRAYLDSPTNVNPEGTVPVPHSLTADGYPMELPVFYDTVYELGDVIEVDYLLPGCPPNGDMVATALTAILEGNLPPKGSILLPDIALCQSCARNETKPDQLTIQEFKRLIHVQADPVQCFLNQGILCMGPATRDGCGTPCIQGNMPCTGCLGPVGSQDQGARMVSALGGIGEAVREEDVATLLDGIPDPAGTFYRYSMSSSFLGSHRKDVKP
ncbi:MAG: oxidoreductase [Fibrobacteria bacterium]|nr:oxidoreductase [Fibrobacteria bacterium]